MENTSENIPKHAQSRLKRYVLEVSENQAEVLNLACEILARLSAGQIRDVTRVLPLAMVDFVRGYLNVAELGLVKSVCKFEKLPISDVAFDLHQVIRHRLSWDNSPSPKFRGVDFDEPRRGGPEPLAAIHAKE